MIVTMMILYVLMLLLVASIVQLSFNNVVPYLTKNSMKIPPINLTHSLSLLILMSMLVKTCRVCENNGSI